MFAKYLDIKINILKPLVMKNLWFCFICSIALIILNTSCNSAESKPTIAQSKVHSSIQMNYSPTVLPKDTTKLWLSEGSKNRDTVLIIGDGGPKNQLDYEYNGKIAMAYLPNFKNYYNVNLHQAASYNREIFKWENEFTLEMAEKETENTTEMMHRAVKYFKDRGKYVVVVGHSYSAFIIPHYIATRNSLADKYIIIGGRFKADSLQTVYQKKDINTRFKEDGKSIIIPDENRPPNPYRTKQYFKIRTAKNLLKAALGQNNFITLLAKKDLQNITFAYGNKDRNVGVPTQEELDFLQSKDVQLIEADSDHYNIWRTVVEKVEDGKIKF